MSEKWAGDIYEEIGTESSSNAKWNELISLLAKMIGKYAGDNSTERREE